VGTNNRPFLMGQRSARVDFLEGGKRIGKKTPWGGEVERFRFLSTKGETDVSEQGKENLGKKQRKGTVQQQEKTDFPNDLSTTGRKKEKREGSKEKKKRDEHGREGSPEDIKGVTKTNCSDRSVCREPKTTYIRERTSIRGRGLDIDASKLPTGRKRPSGETETATATRKNA